MMTAAILAGIVACSPEPVAGKNRNAPNVPASQPATGYRLPITELLAALGHIPATDGMALTIQIPEPIAKREAANLLT